MSILRKLDITNDPYTPLSPRTRRLSAGHARRSGISGASPSPSFLRPPLDFQARNRSASLPSQMNAKSAPRQSMIPKAVPLSPSSSITPDQTLSTLPQPQGYNPTTSASPKPNPPQKLPRSAAEYRFPPSASTSYCEQLKQRPRYLVKPDPVVLLHHVCESLGQHSHEIQHFLVLDDLVALHERELIEKEERGIHRGSSVDYVFGAPLRQVSVYASTTAVLGGLEHELPIVVYACIEELYRTLKAPASPALSSSERVQYLVQIFNTPPHFGCTTSLFKESESDVFAVLSCFLSRLPEPLIYPEGIVNALIHLCLNPLRQNIGAVQRILRFVPSANLSMFVYLLAFLSQVNQTKVGIEMELGHTFGQWLFGPFIGSEMIVWFIKNWSGVVRGLFDFDWDVGMNRSELLVASPILVRAESVLPSPYETDDHSLSHSPNNSLNSVSVCSLKISGESLLDEPEPEALPYTFAPHNAGVPPSLLLRVANPNPGSHASSPDSSISPSSETGDSLFYSSRLDLATSHTSHFMDLEQKLKISNALKEVDLTADAESILSREGAIFMDGETLDGCHEHCAMRARVVILEAYVLEVIKERDNIREMIEEIRKLMAL